MKHHIVFYSTNVYKTPIKCQPLPTAEDEFNKLYMLRGSQSGRSATFKTKQTKKTRD